MPTPSTWGPVETFDFIKNLTILWGPWGLGAAGVLYLLKQLIWAKIAGKRPPE